MTRFRKIVAGSVMAAVAGLGAAAGVEHGSATPATAPATGNARTSISRSQPARAEAAPIPSVSLLAPQPLSSSYSMLLRRSLFAKDHRAKDYHEDTLMSHPVSRESKLVFLGAMQEGTRYKAAVEDNDAHRPMWVFQGDKLPEGTLVREITLDHLIIEKNGSRKRVDVGGTMEGTPVSVADSSAVPASASNPAATASTEGTASENSIEEMMRRRRMQELER